MSNNKSLNEIYSFSNIYKAYEKHSKYLSSIKYNERKSILGVYSAYDEISKKGIYRSKGLYDIKITGGRQRNIKAPHFEERFIQKCFVDNYLLDVLSDHIHSCNVGNINNLSYESIIKSIIMDIRYMINKYGDAYVLLIDFKHYFDSIDAQKALIMLSEFVENKLLMQQIKEYIGDGIGIPFGSPVAQKIAMFYPTRLDHYIKEKLKIKKYKRYMDDLYLMHESKEYLEKCLIEIKEICKSLNLTLNDKKTKIVSIKDFEYLKIHYYVNGNKVFSKISEKKMKSIKRYMKKLAKNKSKTFESVYKSYIAYIKCIGSESDLDGFKKYCRRLINENEIFRSKNTE